MSIIKRFKHLIKIIFILITINNYSNNSNNNDTLRVKEYILFERENPLLIISQSKDTLRTSFFVYKYKFRNKSLRDEYDRIYNEKSRKYLIQDFRESFGTSYISWEKPSIITLNESDIIYNIEQKSKGEVNLGCTVTFIEKIGENKYLAFRSILLAEE